MNKEALKQAQEGLLKSLKGINAEKAEALQMLQQDAATPSLENLEKILDHLNKEFQGLENDHPIKKMIIQMTHKMGALLDVPQEELKALFDKYGIIAPVYKDK